MPADSSTALSPLAVEVRRHDRDRFVTTLFAPAGRREALFALYAFNAEAARIRDLVSEPLLGEMRLQWWRDALATLYGGGELAHPVAQGLAVAIRSHRLTRAHFERLLDARAADLDNGPPETVAALEGYARDTAGTLCVLALEALGARDETAVHAAHHAGVGWALVGLMRSVPFHARAGRLYLPADLLAQHNVLIEDVLAGRSSSGLARVAESLAGRARQHLEQAAAMRNQVPRAARAALLTAPLAHTYLARLRTARYDLSDTNWSAVRPAILRLALRSLTLGY